MQDVLAITLSALQQDAARLDRVSSNLANSATPAYKREVTVQRATAHDPASFSRAVALAAAQAGTRPIAAGAQHEVVRDMRAGTLKPTQQPLDLALAGTGFFEVSTEAGPAYTRHGQFHLDARGRLVNPQGLPVMGLSGEIVLGSSQVSIDTQGNVHEQGRFVAQLKLVDFDRGTPLTAREGGLYEASAPARVLRADQVSLRQGWLENSNVNTMHEMVQLTQTMRHFESMHKTVQAYDEMVGTAIRKLGDL
jgi:flagellar basal-body rod protein FlgG